MQAVFSGQQCTSNALQPEFRPKRTLHLHQIILTEPMIIDKPLKSAVSTFILLLVFSVAGCAVAQDENSGPRNPELAQIFDDYYEAWLILNPLEATGLGEHKYDNLLAVDISESHRNTVRNLSLETITALENVDNSALTESEKLNRDILLWSLGTTIRMLDQPDHLMPVNQMFSMHLEFVTQGSGAGAHPFETPADFVNFMGRMNGFSRWVDAAILNMEEGIEAGVVLPRVNVERVIPQLKSIVDAGVRESLFTKPLKSLSTVDDAEIQLKARYLTAIEEIVLPAYGRLLRYMETTYLAAARESSGLTGIPGGDELYRESIRYWTTTNMRPEQIHELGLSEVARILNEMEQVKVGAGFEGRLSDFVRSMYSSPAMTPFSSEEEILAAYTDMQDQMAPELDRLFRLRPVTPFEVRQVEAYRAASSSAHYQPGSPDGSRPGIFYVPIFNPATFNVMGMESLFAHEAIPGHHYQIAIQLESRDLPEFRNAVYFSAFTEGWALYTESLGEELGLYKESYSDIARLNSELFRAIRLVVDTGLHNKGWSREEAIEYMVRTFPVGSRQAAANQIERYMIMPGQALSYKLGELAIRQLRDEARAALGDEFDIRDFHDRLLLQGAMPLTTLNASTKEWIADQSN